LRKILLQERSLSGGQRRWHFLNTVVRVCSKREVGIM
jgi:hypothetical protein